MTINSTFNIQNSTLHSLFGQTLELLPQKAIYWHEEKLLLLADVHLGKVNHFRKSGIPIPIAAASENIEKLDLLADIFQPEKICFLGDLFHSDKNKEFELFVRWRESLPNVKFELVRGNHDIIGAAHYKQANIKTYAVCVENGPFLFAHEPDTSCPEDKYLFAGHIHPSVKMLGKGRQSLHLPCFYFSDKQALMPAFGAFTGTATIRPKKGDNVFAVADNRVVRLI